MKLTLENSTRVNVVRAYSSTELHIGDLIVRERCLVTPSELITEWAPLTFADLDVSHIGVILDLKPDLVVLGTGPVQRFPSAAIRKSFAQANVGLEAMDLGAACRTYNVLVQEERRVVAAFFLA